MTDLPAWLCPSPPPPMEGRTICPMRAEEEVAQRDETAKQKAVREARVARLHAANKARTAAAVAKYGDLKEHERKRKREAEKKRKAKLREERLAERKAFWRGR